MDQQQKNQQQLLKCMLIPSHTKTNKELTKMGCGGDTILKTYGHIKSMQLIYLCTSILKKPHQKQRLGRTNRFLVVQFLY